MKEFAELALNTVKVRGAAYGDIRIIRTRSERINTKNGKVESVTKSEDLGFCVRVLLNGCWGFASSDTLTKEHVEKISVQATEIAKASALLKKSDVILASEPAHTEYLENPV